MSKTGNRAERNVLDFPVMQAASPTGTSRIVRKSEAAVVADPAQLKPNSAAAREDYALSEQIGHLLRRAYQRHTAIFQSAIPDDKLTSVQFAVLTTVRDHQRSPLVLIARITAIDHATLRDIVLRLKRRGLLSVTTDRHDRRQRLVSLSAAGETLVESVIPDARRITELTLANLNACERLAAIEVLKKLSSD